MEMRKVLAVVLLLAVVLSAVGCKSGGATVTLREVDTGRTVELKRGDQLILELEGNPTTGFQWQVQDMDAGILKQQGDAEFKSDQQGAMGGGGLFVHRDWEHAATIDLPSDLGQGDSPSQDI